MRSLPSFYVSIISSILSLPLLYCGSPSFERVVQNTEVQSPGNVRLAPKIDILLAVSDNGGMDTVLESVSSQTRTFLQRLEEQDWDYRFTTMPLTQAQAELSEVAASKYDANHVELGSWAQPYPGAPSDDPSGRVASSLFRTLGQFGAWVTEIRRDSEGQKENGIENTIQFIERNRASWLRPDALLAVVLVSKGNDTSGAQLTRLGSDPVARYRFSDNNYQSTLSTYSSRLTSVKGGAGAIKVFPVVAYNTEACNYNNQLFNQRGQRYIDFANSFGRISASQDLSLDLCQVDVGQAINNIATQVTEQRLNITTRYLVFERIPDMAQLEVQRIRNGVSSMIPSESLRYLGEQTVYLKEFRSAAGLVRMNQAHGHIVELMGEGAVLVGDDRASVSFKLATPNAASSGN